jgi:FkbM family methyltransferase
VRKSVSDLGRKSAKLARLVRVPAYRQALRHRVGATVEHEKVPFDSSTRTVVDVGAGRGQFGLFALERFPAAWVFSFEPLPESFAIASQTVGGGPRLELRQLAIGAEAGEATIHVTADRDSSSLRSPTDEQEGYFPGTGEVRTLAVEVRTLDEIFATVERPALLKLDVQGGELDVLVGAELLLGSISEVFAECSFIELYEGQPTAEQIISHLSERGFILAGIYSPTYGEDGTCIQADLLFRRRPE